MTRDILATIESGMPSFSKGQRAIGQFILDSYDKAAFMTASRLGQTVHVSESTVVRFAAELGYDGYPGMQKALQEMVRSRLTSVQRIEIADGRLGNQEILSTVMQADIEKIRMTLEETDRESFYRAVEAILSAHRIYVLGARSASALADFLCYYFELIFDNTIPVHATSSSETFEQLLRVGEEDVVIGISFPRYSSRTVKAMRFARERGARVIAITDSEASPLAEIATEKLLAKSDMASFVDSLVAPLSLINALIVAVGRRRKRDIERIFSDLEQIWSEHGVYEQAEDEK
ncbi:MAG TPA: MurR/RpiR family transcriptional regulator [Candidatus Intestinimonas stercoravium]|uniref:MurR/RpiR family transcriptional regulator n=1 Tax=uncultured Intestinimonas sp. TaxID=1689265 RepID=UPI001F9BC697|nr:MurR/RpiR family transcriptional regulator [uncultured Intestinimonas sp.]HJA63073.1 MurR/RpiR family transcriptional regulator [Candidatus Intestinimonas stercoravium]